MKEKTTEKSTKCRRENARKSRGKTRQNNRNNSAESRLQRTRKDKVKATAIKYVFFSAKDFFISKLAKLLFNINFKDCEIRIYFSNN